MDVYRDARCRFAKQQRAVFKKSGTRLFMRLFGRWAELKPVTAESILEGTARYHRALRIAMARTD